jgi:hypothetical protein
MCGVFMNATFHGGSSDTISDRVRRRQPEISPIVPFNFFLSLAATHSLVIVTGNKFIACVVVTGDSLVSLSPAINLSPVSTTTAITEKPCC